ncbi:tetraacyldisaccharide 4'-kinase [Roseibium suaedae]|uniref:Tetraacyldisaccharide 4'-kinase n=1 Tax=Roseibium suaedae TaxID=735517 RepID=A0A1M7AT12_9HYPH|nr:tetraacyldisaccharide 4'-kinase [Roseibium suaedae]SHL45539.1 lipid-A-disaccharide kinase [Roseibium suaedae]
MTKAPDFWFSAGRSWQSVLLAPVGWIYGRVSAKRMKGKALGRAGIPVLCIGNYVLGGAGKTPFSLRLYDRLTDEGFRPGFLLRGYGGRETGPLVVDLERHDAEAVGDEALLLAEAGPVVVSADRVAGAALAQAQDIDVLIMDDGFQNPALAKDLAIVLVDAATGVGNGQCFPAGPLRAPMKDQVVRTDVLAVIGEGAGADETVHMAARRGLPILHGRLQPSVPDSLRNGPLLAFAGIGRPGKFFDSLKDEGLDVAETRSFPDHHPFTQSEAQSLLKTAEDKGLQLVTTAKDMARLRSNEHQIFRWLTSRTEVLPVEMRISDEDRLVTLIRERIRQRTFKPV